MNLKRFVADLISKMPEGVSFGEIIRWVQLLEVLGVKNADQEDLLDEFGGTLREDIKSYFKRPKNGKSAQQVADARNKALQMLARLADDVSIADIMNRLVLLAKIDIALDESERGEVMDHDEFFDQLLNHEEESEGKVASPRTKRSQGDKKPHRGTRSKDRRRVRPASQR